MVTLNPTSLNFGDVPGGEKKTLTSTLTNTGTETLHFNGTTITGMDKGDFSESADCPRSLGAGDYCTIYVTFAPQGFRKAERRSSHQRRRAWQPTADQPIWIRGPSEL